MLISLPTDVSLAAYAQDDFDDILFTSSNIAWNTGTVNDKLAHEIESFDSDTGELVAWVKIPELSSTVDTTIYMYYGNAGVASQQNKTVVWDASTKMVQHMSQDPANPAPQMLDSTVYGNHGTAAGGPVSTTGKIDGATDFDGIDDYVDIADKDSLDFGTGTYSLSWWARYPQTQSTIYGTVFSKGFHTSASYANSFGIAHNSSNTNALRYYEIGDTAGSFATAVTLEQGIADGWHQFNFQRDVAAGKLRLYDNGTLVADLAYSANVNLTNAKGLYLMNAHETVNVTVGADLDEVRIASTARSAAWIATEYQNQSNPTEFYSVGIEEASSPAALSSFGYRKAITIDHTKVSGDLVNFPVLISLPTDASLAAHAQSDADDILFTSNSVAWNTGTVNDKLAHEIESFDSDTGELVAWVKIPELSSTVDTTIYMYYGNGGVASQQNKTVVWDASTKMVQHMNQTGTGAAGDYRDSTRYANHSVNTANQPTVAAGKIGSAESFDGTDDYVDFGNRSSLAFATRDFSISFWIKASVPASGKTIISKGTGNWDNPDVKSININLTPYGEVEYSIDDSVTNVRKVSDREICDSAWHYVSFLFDRQGTGDIYIDGRLDASATISSVGDITSADNWNLGRRPDGYPLPGLLDEVNISDTIRSAAWIATEYQNQSNPTEFYSVGIEEVSSPAALSSFGYRKAITIDHTKVSGDLVNFPVLISLPTDANLAAHAQSDADDILFTSNSVAWNTGTVNDKLAHEIEKYTAATGELVAWVKIPNLSSTADTTIYMYYGNGSIASQQNKTVVWDASTKMVQHMNQNPGGAAPQMLDSTRYANNGTTGGTMTADDLVSGQVDGALDFDGSNDYVDCGDPDRTVVVNAVTASAWIKTTNMTTYKTVLTRRLSGTYGSYALTPTSATEFNFVVRSNGGNRKSPTLSIATLNDGVLHHLVGTYDGTKIRLYLDGAEIGSGTTYYGTVDTPNGGFWIARYQTGGEYLNSIIDEVRVSNTARSAAWIATEYQNQYSPSTFYALGAEQIYQFEVTGSGTQTAGTGQTVTVTAKDAAGNAMAGLDGDLAVIFTGADASLRGTNPTCRDKDGNDIAFGESTVLAFTDGVASCLMKLYKAETANISISGMSVSSTALSVSVTSGAPDNFLVNLPASSDSGESFAATITARDYEYNLADISGTTALSASTGTIAPASVSEGSFTGGVWSGNLTISDVTERPSVTVTATNGSAAGTDAIIITGVPQAPGSVSASRNTDYSITVTWQDSSTVETGYVVERSMDSGSGFGSYQEIGTVEADVASFTDDIASNPADMPIPDRAYRYRVRAYNALGNSAYASDSMTHYTTPNAPSGVGAERLNDVSFRINYTDNAAVTDTHRIERCSNGNCDVSFETNLGTFTSSPQTDSSGIAADSRYRWQARAETPDGVYSAYSASNYEYTAPDAPTIGTVTVISPTEILVNWTDNSAYEDGFRLEVSIDGGAWQEVTSGSNTVGANIYSYSYASAADHNYKFRLRAHIGATSHNSELFSVYSAESAAVYTSLSAPTIQSPVVNSSASITWHWLDNSTAEENHHLHFSLGGGTDVEDIPANATSYETAGLLPNVQYAVHVHAYRASVGESAASGDSSSVYTFANAPLGLTAASDAQNRITLGWGENSNPAGTEYFAENMNTAENSGWITTASWTTGVLECGIEYSFRVKARNHDGVETSYSALLTHEIACTGGAIPAGFSRPPQPPQASAENPFGEFGVVINGGDAIANRPIVKLTLFSGNDTERMALSNDEDFSNASIVPYKKEISWDLADRDSTSQISEVGPRDGVYVVYARFYTKYGVASPTVSDSIRLDMAPPMVEMTDFKNEYLATEEIAVAGKTESGAKIIFNLDSRKAGVIDAASDGKFLLALGKLEKGVHSLQLAARDEAGNSSDTLHLLFEVVAPTAPFSGASSIPESEVPSGNNGEAPSLPNIPASSGDDSRSSESSGPETGPESETPLSKDTPASMSGEWSLLSVKPFPKETTTADVALIVEKFPEFKEIFEKLGLSDSKGADALHGVNLELPVLGKIMGIDSADVAASNLPAIDTPLAELSAYFKEKIPSDIVFVRTKDSNIDISSAMSFEGAQAQQKVSLASGKSFQLILKPDHAVESIDGYFTYKKNHLSRAENPGMWNKVASLLGFVSVASAEDDIEEKMVLSEFEYRDEDGDGIWTADVKTPQVAGEYEVVTVLNYKDISLGKKTLRLVTVVDPEGYVYRLESDGVEARIPDVTVSLYWFNKERGAYELWDAEKYQQQNPQVTDERGAYSFLVPPGSYYLEAEAEGYLPYRSEPFEVVTGSGMHMNIRIEKETT